MEYNPPIANDDHPRLGGTRRRHRHRRWHEHTSAAKTVAAQPGRGRAHHRAPNAEGGGVLRQLGINTLTDETITDNTATTDGTSGDSASAGASGPTTPQRQTATDNTITGGSIAGNTAYEGGGVYVNDGTTDILPGGPSAAIPPRRPAGGSGSRSPPGARATSRRSRRSASRPSAPTRDRYRRRHLSGRRGRDPGRCLRWPSGCNTLTLTNDTIAGNTATTSGGGYYGTGCTTPDDRTGRRPSSSTRSPATARVPPAGPTSRPTTSR